MLSIAKASNQSVAVVERVLSGLLSTLVAILPTIESRKGGVKLNFKLGQLSIQGGCLQFLPETYSSLVKQRAAKALDKLKTAVQTIRED
jgi:hypothetical protein